MRALLALAAMLSLSCGRDGPTTNSCCIPTAVRRGFGYVGTYAGDGGISTQVQLIVGNNGVATVSFLRGNELIVENFETTGR